MIPHAFTRLVDEAFFLPCARELVAIGGGQVARITSVDTIRLERRRADRPEEWDVAIAASAFSGLAILDDGAFDDARIGGIVNRVTVAVDSWEALPFTTQDVISGTAGVAQSFLVTDAVTVTEVDLWLGRNVGATGTARISVFAASGVHGTSAIPTGAAFVSVDVPYADIPSGDATKRTIAIEGSLAVGTYCLAVEPIGSVGSLFVGRGDTNLHAGNRSSRALATWAAHPTTDTFFAVRGVAPVSTEADYMIVAECSVAMLPSFGGGAASMVFRRPARILASALLPSES